MELFHSFTLSTHHLLLNKCTVVNGALGAAGFVTGERENNMHYALVLAAGLTKPTSAYRCMYPYQFI